MRFYFPHRTFLSPLLSILFVIFFVTHSLAKSDPALKWDEPEWADSGSVKLTRKLSTGETATYRKIERTTVKSGKRERKLGHSITVSYSTGAINSDGSARVVVDWMNLNARGSGSEFLRFIESVPGEAGSFTMTENGEMRETKGAVTFRSLPVFLDAVVDVGDKWSAPASIAYSPSIPEAVAECRCSYLLTGLARHSGSIFARIEFSGQVELAQNEFVMKRNLGVRMAEGVEDLKGIFVGEIAPGYPADKAGLKSGDKILSFAAMKVEKWSDLRYAISLAPRNAASVIEIERDGKKQSLPIKPIIATFADLQIEGNIKGTIFYDVTAGRPFRIEINPFSMDVIIESSGREIFQEVTIKAVWQLMNVEPQKPQ